MQTTIFVISSDHQYRLCFCINVFSEVSSESKLLRRTRFGSGERYKDLAHDNLRYSRYPCPSIQRGYIGVGLITPGHPRIPQDTPGHPMIPQDTPKYPRTHLISDIIHLFIHLFIHSDENKAKMASNSFHLQVHSFEMVLLNTAEKPQRHHTDLQTYKRYIFHISFTFFLLLLSSSSALLLFCRQITKCCNSGCPGGILVFFIQ